MTIYEAVVLICFTSSRFIFTHTVTEITGLSINAAWTQIMLPLLKGTRGWSSLFQLIMQPIYQNMWWFWLSAS